MIRFLYAKVMVILSVLTFSLSVFTSCENEGDFTPHNDLLADREIRVSTSVSELVETRAATETFPYENIGLYIRPTSAGSIPETITPDNWEHEDRNAENSISDLWYTYPNVKFTNNGSGWTQDEYTPMFWKSSDVEYEYYAYAPYDASVTYGNIIYYDLGQNQTDLLWASKTGQASSLVNSDGKLDIHFGHVFCKVKVNITLADEFYQGGSTVNPIDKVAISSSRASGFIDLFTGKVSNESGPFSGSLTIAEKPSEGEIAGEHTAGNSSHDGTYVSPSIFYAPGNETFKVTITTTDGRTHTYTHSVEYTFESGKSYIIKLQVGKDVIQLSKETITASDWVDGGKIYLRN